MQMKDGLDDDLWEMTGQQETVRGPRLWEDSMTMWRLGARRCTYKKRLAEVGLVWWSDVTNEKGDGWMTWSEATRVHELRGKTDKEDYEQLLGELNGQPEATTAQWFAGRHERWDEAGLEWNRSDQRIAIRMAADASTEQRGIRNGQVKGEDKWTYERIDGARRTGETGEDATERWEYLIKWKGATKRTWERHRTIAAMGGETEVELSLGTPQTAAKKRMSFLRFFKFKGTTLGTPRAAAPVAPNDATTPPAPASKGSRPSSRSGRVGVAPPPTAAKDDASPPRHSLVPELRPKRDTEPTRNSLDRLAQGRACSPARYPTARRSGPDIRRHFAEMFCSDARPLHAARKRKGISTFGSLAGARSLSRTATRSTARAATRSARSRRNCRAEGLSSLGGGGGGLAAGRPGAPRGAGRRAGARTTPAGTIRGGGSRRRRGRDVDMPRERRQPRKARSAAAARASKRRAGCGGLSSGAGRGDAAGRREYIPWRPAPRRARSGRLEAPAAGRDASGSWTRAATQARGRRAAAAARVLRRDGAEHAAELRQRPHVGGRRDAARGRAAAARVDVEPVGVRAAEGQAARPRHRRRRLPRRARAAPEAAAARGALAARRGLARAAAVSHLCEFHQHDPRRPPERLFSRSPSRRRPPEIVPFVSGSACRRGRGRGGAATATWRVPTKAKSRRNTVFASPRSRAMHPRTIRDAAAASPRRARGASAKLRRRRDAPAGHQRKRGVAATRPRAISETAG